MARRAVYPKIMLKLECTGGVDERTAHNHNPVRLCPITISGLLCVGGRLDKLRWPHAAKHTIILSPRHNVTRLIVWYSHVLIGHCGLSRTLSELHQRCWIVQGVSMAKRVLHGCWTCRRNFTTASRQVMAPPPTDGIQPGWHPFKWPLSAMDDYKTSSDGLVRTVVVRTRDGRLRRDGRKIGLIEDCE
ncbi:hypothetical protein CRM22_002473 [Opisthorchis felineus]|uniref:Integrase zinc-binding domain-containing protein n=1 Tax=Opisthorchis felineus TaxID=147828 RepID=A0A4S2M5W7_OPIFE|nr:hypothetical protein CRM22_002473 [Opisthorchis felineus]